MTNPLTPAPQTRQRIRVNSPPPPPTKPNPKPSTGKGKGTGSRGRPAPQALPKPKPKPLHIGFTRNSRHGDTLATLALLSRSGIPLVAHLIERDWQAERAGQLDAVLIGGGADIDPALYGERNWGARGIDRARDRLELQLISAALGAGVPVLGICRGAQLLNVALGGTLHQDTYQDLGVRHAPRHSLRVDPALKGVIPSGPVNSSHHQAVKGLGEGLVVVGRAPDGVPEIWQGPGVLGVQFHPETLARHDPRWLSLFRYWLRGLDHTQPQPSTP